MVDRMPRHEREQIADSDALIGSGISLGEGMQLVDRGQHTELRLDQSVDYPRDVSTDSALYGRLLLKRVRRSDPNSLLFPEHPISLAYAINESAGMTDSFEVAPQQSRTIALFEQLFERLGRSIDAVAVADHVLPATLDYRRIIIQRDTLDCKILPPLFLQKAETDKDIEKQKRKLATDLIAGLVEGAETQHQRELVQLLIGVVKKSMQEKSDEQ